MTCEWCRSGREAKWWASSICGLWARMCDACLERVGIKLADGIFDAIPIEEHLALSIDHKKEMNNKEISLATPGSGERTSSRPRHDNAGPTSRGGLYSAP